MSDNPLGSASALGDVLAHLAETIDARAGADPSASYTAKLLAAGPLECGKKIVEEAGELALAITAQGEAEGAAEAADLLYHALVGLRSRGVSLDAVAEALAGRQGISGLAEKAGRETS